MITAIKVREAFWSPEGITFTIPQIKWLLQYYYIIIEGRWPQGPADYVKPPNPKGRYYRPNAYFTRPCEVLAELDMRLQRVDLLARSALHYVYCWGFTYEYTAKQHHVDDSTLYRHCKEALKIMSQPNVLVENPIVRL